MPLCLLLPNPKLRKVNPTDPGSPGSSCSKTHGQLAVLATISGAATDPFSMWNCNPILPQTISLGFITGAQGLGLITIFNGTHIHITTV